jgi:hypoxanthine-DNA glycosylase
MDYCESFKAVVSNNTRILILGSMPGVKSIDLNEYYAHPQNKFWDIIEACFGIQRSTPYYERLVALTEQNLGLWDVIESCERKGSLDSAIKNAKPNDFQSLLTNYGNIETVFCNGKKSEALFRKEVLPTLSKKISVVSLPSTSPANARLAFVDKLEQWSDAFRNQNLKIKSA